MVARPARQDEPHDAELVQRAQAGAATAFGELVSRYQDRIYNTCYRMCHHEADALDLTQNTFLKALEALPRFEGRSSFYTWLFRIAVNLAMTHRRSKSRRQAASLEAAASDGKEIGNALPTNKDADATEPARQKETQDRVLWALEHLDVEFRIAVVLKDIEDMDYARIAEILDIPAGTVKSRIHRGRVMLHDLLTGKRKPVDAA